MSRARSSSAVLAALGEDPDSVPLHLELLHAYACENDWTSQARADCILWLVAHDPANAWCRTPLAHVDPGQAPALYEAIRLAWMHLASAADADADVLCGAAHFVASLDPTGSLVLLRRAIEARPDDPILWVELGRISRDPDARLAAFLEACARGAQHPNLLAWTALSAATAGDVTTAERLGLELLELVSEARRQHGDKLDWKDCGRDLWARARQESVDDDAASQLITEISAHAYHKHFAHTVLGLVAAQRGNLTAAVDHLQQSARIEADHRLQAYGPSSDLLRVVCEAGHWAEGERFLRTWAAAWPNDNVDELLVHVERRKLPPDMGALPRRDGA